MASIFCASCFTALSLPLDGRPPKDTAAQRERHGEQVLKDWLAKGSVQLARGLAVATAQRSEMGELTLDIDRVCYVS